MDAIPLDQLGSAISGVVEQLKLARTLAKAGGIADLALPGEINPKDTIQFVGLRVIIPGGLNAIPRTQEQESFGDQVTETVEEAFESVQTQDPVTTTERQEPSETVQTSDEVTSSESSNQTTNQNQTSATGGGNTQVTEITYE